MKELNEEIISKASRNCPQEIKIILLSKYNIKNFSSLICSSIEFLDLSNNEINSFLLLFQQFPSSWWINISNNDVNFFLNIFSFSNFSL